MTAIKPFFEIMWVLVLLLITFELFRVCFIKVSTDSKINDDLVNNNQLKSLAKEYRYTKIVLLVVLWLHFAQKVYDTYIH